MPIISVVASSSASGTITGSGAGSTGTAPNITSATGIASYFLWANQSSFGFTGTITLPTTDPHYSDLVNISVVATGPDGKDTPIASFTAPYTGSTITYSGGIFEMPNSVQSWTLTFICSDSTGTPTTGPYSIGSITVNPSAVTAVTAGEHSGGRYPASDTRLVHGLFDYTPTLGNNIVPQNVTLWISSYSDPTKFTWIGWQPITTVGQTLQVDRLIPSSTQIWKIAVCAGAIGGDPSVALSSSDLPTGTVISAGFSVTGLSLPSASLISTLLYSSPASGYNPNWPYNAITPDGTQFWEISQIGYDDTPCLADPEAFFVRITATSLDAAKTAISPEKAYAGTQVTGGVATFDPLMGSYGPDSSGLSSNNMAYLRLKVYVCNRLDQTAASFLNTDCATLQTGIGSGTGHVDILVATSGNLPPAGIPATRFDPSTLGSGLTGGGGTHVSVKYGAAMGDDGSGGITPKLAATLTVISNQITIANNAITNTYLAPSAVQATNMAANAVTAANGALGAAAVVDSNIASMSISKLISGTVIFTGDVYMSRGSGYPIIGLNSGGMYLYGAGSGSSGYTSNPYVVIQSSSMGLYSGGNASMTLSSSAFYLWSVNGNSSYPYLNLTSSGVTVASGSVTNQMSSSQITLSYSGGVSTTINSAGLTVINGTYQFNVNSSYLQLWSVASNSSYPCVGLTTSQLSLTAGSYTTTISASQIQMTNGSASLTLNSTGVTIANGSYSLVATASSLTLAYSGGSQVQLTSTSVTLQANSSNYVSISTSGSVSITSGSVSTTINGNNFGTGYLTCATANVTPGNLVLGIGSGSSLGGTIVFPWQQVSSTSSGGYITPPSIQGFLTIYINNGSNTAYKLAYYLA